MRPDLGFTPPSGSSIAPGSASVVWTAPAATTGLLVIAGTSPGDSDLVNRASLAPDEPIAFTAPADARRIYVQVLLDTNPEDSPRSYGYSLVFPVLGAQLPPETVIRRLLATYFLEEWLGPNLNERRFCPAGVPSVLNFDPENEDDASPWTPAEIRNEVGYVLLRFQEVDRFDDGVTCGSDDAQGGTAIISGEYLLWNLEFEFVVPSKSNDAAGVIEQRRFEIESLFRGFAIFPENAPVLSIRNLTRYPSRRREGGDDGSWRRAWLDVKVRIRVRTTHAGVQEVALP